MSIHKSWIATTPTTLIAHLWSRNRGICEGVGILASRCTKTNGSLAARRSGSKLSEDGQGLRLWNATAMDALVEEPILCIYLSNYVSIYLFGSYLTKSARILCRLFFLTRNILYYLVLSCLSNSMYPTDLYNLSNLSSGCIYPALCLSIS